MRMFRGWLPFLRMYYRRAAFWCAFFLWAKELNAKDIHKEIFSFTVGSVCRVKRFTADGQRFANDEEVKTGVRKWLRQQSKDFYAAHFDEQVERWDLYRILVEDMSRNKCFFSALNITFYVLYPFVTYLLTLPRIIFPSMFISSE
jgi:hypothetical protein